MSQLALTVYDATERQCGGLVVWTDAPWSCLRLRDGAVNDGAPFVLQRWERNAWQNVSRHASAEDARVVKDGKAQEGRF